MREIIHLQGGKCGNTIGTEFLEAITHEHGIDPEGYLGKEITIPQVEKIEVYYKEVKHGKLQPRALMFDFDSQSLDNIRISEYRKLFTPENYIQGEQGGGTWANAFYSAGSGFLDNIMESIRKEIEQCESLQGFQLTHSIGGGTGSGVGSLLVQNIKDYYPDKMLATFSVFPSNKETYEHYNATLAIHHLIENSDECIVLDNEALHNICINQIKCKPVYADMNMLIQAAMTGVTCSLRFPGQLNQDLRKQIGNLVPYPRAHFLMASIAPLVWRGSCLGRVCFTPAQLTQQMFDARNMMVAADPRHGRYLSGCAIYRGKLSPVEVQEQHHYSNKNSSYFVEWIPNNFKYDICEINQRHWRSAVSFLGNSTAIQEMFIRIKQDMSYEKKTFLNMYTNEGMDEMEFMDANNNINDLLSEYQQYQNMSAYDDINEEEA